RVRVEQGRADAERVAQTGPSRLRRLGGFADLGADLHVGGVIRPVLFDRFVGHTAFCLVRRQKLDHFLLRLAQALEQGTGFGRRHFFRAGLGYRLCALVGFLKQRLEILKARRLAARSRWWCACGGELPRCARGWKWTWRSSGREGARTRGRDLPRTGARGRKLCKRPTRA